MKKFILLLLFTILQFGVFSTSTLSAQVITHSYKVESGNTKTVLIENGKLYRITIKSCWYSAYARIGSYLVYGLNVADPKTDGKPCVLTTAETPQIDWSFIYSRSGSYDANMKIKSNGWGDQGLLVIVEELPNN